MARHEIELELLPLEREFLSKWNHTPDVRRQLEALASSQDVESIKIDRYVLRWLASDPSHAIVKRGCRDADAIQLSERLDDADQSGDGWLDSWY